MRGASNGLSQTHCRYHVQQKARHGSHWHPTYTASELRPYLKSVQAWLRANLKDSSVASALMRLDGLLTAAGAVEHYNDLVAMPPAKKAQVALARVRDAGIKSVRLLAIHMAVSALIEDDGGSHRIDDFRIVQVAKCVHRLASGTHRRWEIHTYEGRSPVVSEMHKYPRPSGRPLRYLGKAIEAACEHVIAAHLQDIIKLRRERYGLHPSQLPGWVPEWRKAYLKGQAAR